MGIVYAAKAPADYVPPSPSPTPPPTWPIGWNWPGGGIIPPGYEPNYTATVSTDATVYGATPGGTITDPVTIECRTLDGGVGTDAFLGGTITIQAKVGETIVPIRESGDSVWLDEVEVSVETISAEEFGSDIVVEFDGAGLDGETMTISMVANQGGPYGRFGYGSTTAAIDISNFSFTVLVDDNNVVRSTDFSVTIEANDQNGLLSSFSGTVSLSISGGDTGDVLSISEAVFSSGSWSGNVQVSGGSIAKSGVTIVPAYTGFTVETNDPFNVVIASDLSTSSLLATEGHSYSFFSGGYYGEGDADAAGYLSEFGQARAPAEDNNRIGTHGIAGSSSSEAISIEFNGAVIDDYGLGTIADVARTSIGFDISSVKGQAANATLRVSISGNGVTGTSGGSISLYSSETAPSGTAAYEKHASILSAVGSAYNEGSITFANAHSSVSANGYFDISVSADSINNASGDTLYFHILTSFDAANVPPTYASDINVRDYFTGSSATLKVNQ